MSQQLPQQQGPQTVSRHCQATDSDLLETENGSATMPLGRQPSPVETLVALVYLSEEGHPEWLLHASGPPAEEQHLPDSQGLQHGPHPPLQCPHPQTTLRHVLGLRTH